MCPTLFELRLDLYGLGDDEDECVYYLDRGQAALRLVCCIELDTVTPAFLYI